MDVSHHRLLQNIFRSYTGVLAQKKLPSSQRNAIESIVDCRSGRLGSSYYSCDEGHDAHEQPHSCRHRSCYLCARNSRRVWIEEQKKRLLNCPHFHMVFTLPSEYRVLWQYNRAWFTQALFQSVKETILTLMKDERYQGVTPGLILALHTWGRQLNLHPHIHAVVTAGGLDKDGQWQDSGQYLLPVRVLKALYRGKLQHRLKSAIESGDLAVPPSMNREQLYSIYHQAYQKAWSVRVEEQYSHGKGVVLYLSKYLKGGPLHPSQIRRCDAQIVSFVYKDHRDQRHKTLELKPSQFIDRLLMHVPEPGIHTVRHYGLYGSAARASRNTCRDLLGCMNEIEASAVTATRTMAAFICRTCSKVMVLRHRQYPKKASKGNSIIRQTQRGVVQQDDETDHNSKHQTDYCYAFG